MIELKVNGHLYARTTNEKGLRAHLGMILGLPDSYERVIATHSRLNNLGYTAVISRSNTAVLLSIDDNALDKIYLDWVNNFISTEAFAGHYAINPASAKKLLEKLKEAA